MMIVWLADDMTCLAIVVLLCDVSSTLQLCQEVLAVDPKTDSLRCLHRGPRIRAGMHVGRVEVAVNIRTGRLAFRGRVMNRAARIASKAQDGQVVVSAAALRQWHAPLHRVSEGAATNSTTSTNPTTVSGTSRVSRLFGGSTTSDASDAVAAVVARLSAVPRGNKAAASNSSGGSASPAAPTAAVSAAMKLRLTADRIGTFALKGVSEIMELFECKLLPATAPAGLPSSTLDGPRT